MIDSAAIQMGAHSHMVRAQPFGIPSENSEVSRIPDFYRVECLTVFGAARCETENVAETAESELQAAA